MAKFYTKAKIVGTESPKPFADANGEMITYFKNYVKVDGDMLEMNSSKDFSSEEGNEGVATITARKNIDGKSYRLSLTNFTEGEDLEIPEETIH